MTKDLMVHETDFSTDEPGDDGASVQVIYHELAAHTERNDLIAREIICAAADGRTVLALANRLSHSEVLHDLISSQVDVLVLVLHGRLAAPERRTVRQTLGDLNESGSPFAPSPWARWRARGSTFLRSIRSSSPCRSRSKAGGSNRSCGSLAGDPPRNLAPWSMIFAMLRCPCWSGCPDVVRVSCASSASKT